MRNNNDCGESSCRRNNNITGGKRHIWWNSLRFLLYIYTSIYACTSVCVLTAVRKKTFFKKFCEKFSDANNNTRPRLYYVVYIFVTTVSISPSYSQEVYIICEPQETVQGGGRKSEEKKKDRRQISRRKKNFEWNNIFI